MGKLITGLRLIIGGRKMDIRYCVKDVAKYFLSKEAMTPKKLQKILYFAYSWYLAMMNESRESLNVKLFNNKFEAWIHGPVCPDIYFKYRKHGADKIPKYSGNLHGFDEEDKEILDQVWDVYGEFTANQLESITHQHAPWKKTREENECSSFDWCDAQIDDKEIFDYYVKQLISE